MGDNVGLIINRMEFASRLGFIKRQRSEGGQQYEEGKEHKYKQELPENVSYTETFYVLLVTSGCVDAYFFKPFQAAHQENCHR